MWMMLSVALDKAFAQCFQGFAECHKHSAKFFPVVRVLCSLRLSAKLIKSKHALQLVILIALCLVILIVSSKCLVDNQIQQKSDQLPGLLNPKHFNSNLNTSKVQHTYLYLEIKSSHEYWQSVLLTAKFSRNWTSFRVH